MTRRRLRSLPGLSLLLLLVLAAPASAEEAWERAVEEARQKQDREIKDARRLKNMARVVNQYKSKLSRQRTVLNIYLVGRAIYYDADYDREQAYVLASAGKNEQAQALVRQAHPKALASIRYMQDALKAEPRFWYADRSLAQLYPQVRQVDQAIPHLQRVLRRHPFGADALKLAIQIHRIKRNHSQVEHFARRYLARHPDEDMSVRFVLVQCLADQKKLAEAVKEMEIIVRARRNDPELRMSLAVLLYQLAFAGKPKGAKPDPAPMRKAANQLERLLRLRPNSYDLLKLLEEVYFHLEDRQNLERIIKRMIPLAPSAEERRRLEDNLARLQGGGRLGAPPEAVGRKGPQPKDKLTELIEQALDESDPKKRLAALQTYLDARIPFLPLVLYARVDPSIEGNFQCRILLLRILGQMEAIEAIKHIARGLWDPVADVRAVAADELGKYTHKGILLYLEPALFNFRMDPLPMGIKARKEMERGYNALRDAIHNHTKYRDRELMAEGAIPCEKLAANRERWAKYFKSDAGRYAFLDALAAFEELKDPFPERYLLLRAAGEDQFLDVRQKAYGILKRHAEAMQKSDQAFMKKRWADFPIFDPATISKETSTAVTRRLMDWYHSTRSDRPAEPSGKAEKPSGK